MLLSPTTPHLVPIKGLNIPANKRKRSVSKERKVESSSSSHSSSSSSDSSSEDDDSISKREIISLSASQKKTTLKKHKADKDETKTFRNTNPGRRIIGGRLYDSELGVTCHWCRQKTVEDHAFCSRCTIAFCGGCLKNRHGEKIYLEMQEDVKWVCPKCRGGCGAGCNNCCNCGPCRKSQGMEPTGLMVHTARAAGFSNVHDYLVHLKTGETQERISQRKVGKSWCKTAHSVLKKQIEKYFKAEEKVTEERDSMGVSTQQARLASGPTDKVLRDSSGYDRLQTTPQESKQGLLISPVKHEKADDVGENFDNKKQVRIGSALEETFVHERLQSQSPELEQGLHSSLVKLENGDGNKEVVNGRKQVRVGSDLSNFNLGDTFGYKTLQSTKELGHALSVKLEKDVDKREDNKVENMGVGVGSALGEMFINESLQSKSQEVEQWLPTLSVKLENGDGNREVISGKMQVRVGSDFSNMNEGDTLGNKRLQLTKELEHVLSAKLKKDDETRKDVHNKAEQIGIRHIKQQVINGKKQVRVGSDLSNINEGDTFGNKRLQLTKELEHVLSVKLEKDVERRKDVHNKAEQIGIRHIKQEDGLAEPVTLRMELDDLWKGGTAIQNKNLGLAHDNGICNKVAGDRAERNGARATDGISEEENMPYPVRVKQELRDVWEFDLVQKKNLGQAHDNGICNKVAGDRAEKNGVRVADIFLEGDNPCYPVTVKRELCDLWEFDLVPKTGIPDKGSVTQTDFRVKEEMIESQLVQVICIDDDAEESAQNEWQTLAVASENSDVPCLEKDSISKVPSCLRMMENFREDLVANLQEPFNARELEDMLEAISCRKPIYKARETRQGTFQFATQQEGYSYLDHHPDLANRLASTNIPEEKLCILRGFFFWLKHASAPGVFKPWVTFTAQQTKVEDDCTEVDGPDCKILGIIFPVEEQQNAICDKRRARDDSKYIRQETCSWSTPYDPHVKVKQEVDDCTGSNNSQDYPPSTAEYEEDTKPSNLCFK